jgi:hypothetical protein
VSNAFSIPKETVAMDMLLKFRVPWSLSLMH